MIQLTIGGPRIVKDAGWVAQQREFAHHHCVVFKDFVEESILRRVPRMLEAGEFFTREDVDGKGEVFARELKMRAANPLLPMFLLLLNHPRLFGAIGELTGSEQEIRFFKGRCFKFLPGGGHFDTWHTDGSPGKLYGLTINLSPKPVEGGAFHLRRRKTGEILRTIPSGRFGDARLFRIHRSLEHKVSLVQGTEPRCTYAGWFRGGADHPHYREVIRKVLVRAPLIDE